MGKQGSYAPGILRPAPEGFLDEGTIGEISGQGVDARRRQLLKSSFLGALATTLATAVRADGDPDILEIPPWSRQLGNAVAHEPYGLPSSHEKNIIRRQSPGLTRQRNPAFRFRRCRECSESLPPAASISSATTRAG